MHAVDHLILNGDSRLLLKTYHNKFDLIMTSPPYADARNKLYDSVKPDDYVEWFLSFSGIFKDSLKESGSLIINIKDKIVNGVKHRYVWDLIKALTNDGWYSIEDYIWTKPNPMPGFWPTRLSDAWEYCFHLSKTKKPYFNHESVKKPIGDWSKSRLTSLTSNDFNRKQSITKSDFGRKISNWMNKDKVLPNNVLNISNVASNKGHPAVFPIKLPSFFIKLLCPINGWVLDPFSGSGTTGVASKNLNRNFVLIDNNSNYCDLAKQRVANENYTDL